MSFSTTQNAAGRDRTTLDAILRADGTEVRIRGEGGGSVEAFAVALQDSLDAQLRVLDYHEHGIGSGSDVNAVCYMELQVGDQELWGVGMHSDIVTASLRAIVSGLNRSIESR